MKKAIYNVKSRGLDFRVIVIILNKSGLLVQSNCNGVIRVNDYLVLRS